MADTYDCCENEDLSHEHPDDAIEEYLDAREASNWPRVLQVKAWDHSIIVELDKDRFAEWAIDNLLENLHDNYGGDDYVDIAPEQQRLIEAAARNFVDVTVAAYGQPWRCDRVPREDEWVVVAAWVLDNKPEWIEEDPQVRAFVEEADGGAQAPTDGIVNDSELVGLEPDAAVTMPPATAQRSTPNTGCAG